MVVLLGPQRLAPTIAPTLDALGIRGRIAAITAGWQEREGEDDELDEHLGKKSFNLRLYHRTHVVFSRDPELSQALHRRQNRLQELQRLYSVRLRHGLDAVQELRGRRESDLAASAAEDAMAAVRMLDAEHLERMAEVHREFEAGIHLEERDGVMAERREIAARLAEASVVAVAGGHVAVLLNRLRLFDIVSMLDGKPVVAWSGGAMVTGERIVLFHDSPPQGPGYAEVLESGLGLHRGLVPFPHARRRLRLHDPDRVVLVARRFRPAVCVAMDDRDRIDWEPGRGWRAPGGIGHLREDGTVDRIRAVAV
jgi:hypothetical protein